MFKMLFSDSLSRRTHGWRVDELTAGTRAGDFVLTREAAAGEWGAETYSLVRR
jgi:hypothetical protein